MAALHDCAALLFIDGIFFRGCGSEREGGREGRERGNGGSHLYYSTDFITCLTQHYVTLGTALHHAPTLGLWCCTVALARINDAKVTLSYCRNLNTHCL